MALSDNLCLSFPVLQPDRSDFVDGVAYAVEARSHDRRLEITHVLSGRSFIRDLIEQKQAQFSVRLLYRNSSERLCCPYVMKGEDVSNPDELRVVQEIPNDFSYAPEVMPSIVATQDITLAKKAMGLSDFWDNEEIRIPKHARVALYPKLVFSGTTSFLFERRWGKDLEKGTIRVEVNRQANEGVSPIILYCAKNIYQHLERHKLRQSNASAALSSAIITQALCTAYSYLKKQATENAEICAGLKYHLEYLEQETGMRWDEDDFDPCLAATKMRPYVLEFDKDDD